MDQKDSYVNDERQSILDVLILKDTFFFSAISVDASSRSLSLQR